MTRRKRRRCPVCHGDPKPVRLNEWLVVRPRCAACGREVKR